MVASRSATALATRYGAFDLGGIKAALSGEVPKSLASDLTLSVAASPLMADGTEGNPRQVKRFLIAFAFAPLHMCRTMM